MSIGAAISDLVKSFLELFSSIFGGIYNTVHAIFSAVFGLFGGFITLIADVFQGAFDVVGGVGKFLISNIVIVAIVAAGGFAYVRYQQQQGRSVGAAPQKKTI